MKRIETIKDRRLFTDIIKTGKYQKGKYFIIYSKPNNDNNTRFGIAVSKSLGKAVVRNYYKRIYRDIIDRNKLLFKNGQNYIIMIKSASLSTKFETINKTMKELLEKGV